MEGRRMTLLLQPEHKNPATAKQPVVGGTAPAAPKTPVGAPRPAAPLNAGSSLNIPSRPANAAPPITPPITRQQPEPVSR
jgi:hypothetical protein